MYTFFKIRNFRCFQDLELDDLALVNLIAGTNNVGKTALLEAIFTHFAVYNPELAVLVNAFRGAQVIDSGHGHWAEHPLDSLFNQFDVSKTIELSGKDIKSDRTSLRIRTAGAEEVQEMGSSIDEFDITKYSNYQYAGILSSSKSAEILRFEHEGTGEVSSYYMIMDRAGLRANGLPPVPTFQVYFQSTRTRIDFQRQAELYGNLELRGEQDQVLKALQIIEPRLKNLRVVALAGISMLHGDIGIGRLVPLPVMGEGMVRLANLILYISDASNGVVLVDEIENGLHYSVIPNIWKAIALAARQSNTQVFATTHSWGCIKAAHEAFASEETYDFRLHRLGWLNGEIKAVTYDQESLAASLKHELEVR